MSLEEYFISALNLKNNFPLMHEIINFFLARVIMKNFIFECKGTHEILYNK